MCPQRAATETNRFIVGTCSLHDDNEISVLEYNEDSNQIDSMAVFSHPDQIWNMESSPQDPSLLLTCRQPKDGRFSVSLWKMSNQSKEDISSGASSVGFNGDASPLEELHSFSGIENSQYQFSWSKTRDNILFTSSSSMANWTVTESNTKVSINEVLSYSLV